jgi:hypothetical protein
LLNKELNIHEEFVAVEDTSFYDQEIGDLQNDKLSVDAFDIVPNASTILSCHEDQIIHFRNSKDNQQIDISTDDSFKSAANTKDSPQLSDLQTKGDCSRYEEEDDELKSPDQQFIIYVSPTEVEKSTFNMRSLKAMQYKNLNSQLEQQLKEVFLCDFDDPIADYLEFMSNINVKIFCQMKVGSVICSNITFLHAMVSFIFWVKIKNRLSVKSVSYMASLEA